jgi:hypothetical protein
MTERDLPVTTPDAPLTPTQPAAPPVPAAAAPPPVAPAPVVVSKRSGGGRWVNVLLGAALVVAVGGVAFAVGRSTAPASAAIAFPDGGIVINGPTGSFDPGSVPGVRPGGPGGLLGAGPTVQGTVTAIDEDSMTVRLASGDEVEIALDDTTTYHEATATDASAVAVGDEVAVQADGGRFTIGGDGGTGSQGGGTAPDAVRGLTAVDVTVRR